MFKKGDKVVFAFPDKTCMGTSTDRRTGKKYAVGDIFTVESVTSDHSYVFFDETGATAWAAEGFRKVEGIKDLCDKTVGPDQEVWVKERIQAAIRMAIAAFQQTRVRADSPLMAGLLEGIANGAAVEVVRTLGLRPGFVNLRRVDDTAPVSSSTPDAKPEPKPSGGRTVTGTDEDNNLPVTCGFCGKKGPRYMMAWSPAKRLVCTVHLRPDRPYGG